MTQAIQSVCVYCGASQNIDDFYKNAIEELARGLVAAGKTIVYGGGSVGTMGYLADAAMKAGGKVIGIIPEHIIAREGMDHDITELIVVDSMHNRKMAMVEHSDAFISMPGGMGTLDETFEILTWKYLNLHKKPIILANINNYWTPLLKLLDNMIREGYTPEHHLELFDMADNVKDVIGLINSYDIEYEPQARTDRM